VTVLNTRAAQTDFDAAHNYATHSAAPTYDYLVALVAWRLDLRTLKTIALNSLLFRCGQLCLVFDSDRVIIENLL
jgi:hypothetical protein